jgi:hypothetical protein
VSEFSGIHYDLQELI